MRTIRLRENQPTFLSATELDVEQIEVLKGAFPGFCKIETAVSHVSRESGYRISIDGHVGMIGLGSDTQIEIAPKIPMNNVLELLRWARTLRLRETGPKSTQQDSDDFLDRWIGVFISETEDILAAGLRRTYVERIERAMPIRGRIDVRRTMRRPGRVAPICRFPDFTPDNPHNQLILATILQLKTTPDLTPHTARALASLEHQLSQMVSRLRPSAALALPLRYTPITEHYQTLHQMCRLILTHAAGGVTKGPYSLRGFAFRTADLFEDAVFELLRRRLDCKYRILRKGTKRFADDESIGKMRFDIRIYDQAGNPLAVLDCKYKEGSQHSDTYQVVAYAKALDIQRAALVYPIDIPSPHAGYFGSKEPIRVESFVFDVSASPDVAANTLVSELHVWLQTQPTERANNDH